jgi:hypothetical protein
MYVTPSLLSAEDWDTIAEAAKWARANADVLVDSHWIGGDPNKLEVYGCASWSSRKGILTLRNPLDKPQALQETIERVARRVVARVDRAQHVRAGHAHLGRELLDTHGADHLPERELQIHALVDRRQQELTGESRIAKVLREPDVPIFTSSCHGVCPPDTPSMIPAPGPRLPSG